MSRERRVVYIGEEIEGGDYWAHCFFCKNEICVYRPATDEGQLSADAIIENGEGWLFADSDWICPQCLAGDKKEPA